MTTIMIPQPDTSELIPERDSLLAKAAAMVVRDTESHYAAVQVVSHIKCFEKKWTEHFEPSRAALDKAKKEILRARDSVLEPAVKIREALTGRALAWEKMERERAEAEALLLAEQERQRLEQLAAEEAAMAEAAGDEEAALDILTTPAPEVVMVPQPQIAKVEGVSRRVSHVAEVYDLAALVKYAAENGRHTLLEANMPVINMFVRADPKGFDIPGVRVVEKTTLVNR